MERIFLVIHWDNLEIRCLLFHNLDSFTMKLSKGISIQMIRYQNILFKKESMHLIYISEIIIMAKKKVNHLMDIFTKKLQQQQMELSLSEQFPWIFHIRITLTLSKMILVLWSKMVGRTYQMVRNKLWISLELFSVTLILYVLMKPLQTWILRLMLCCMNRFSNSQRIKR